MYEGTLLALKYITNVVTYKVEYELFMYCPERTGEG